MLAGVAGRDCAAGPGRSLPAARDARLAAVCDLLLRDPADRRSLAQLGAAAGVSQRTLTRLFAQEMGMTFPQWRTQLRLRRCRTGRPTSWAIDAHAHPGLPGRSGRGRSMMLGPHVRGWITLLVRRICALCRAWVVDDG